MRLERSRTDARLFGLCGGISRSLEVNSAWVRAGFTVGAVFSGGVLLLIYVALAMLMPLEEPRPEGGYWYVPSPRAYGFSNVQVPAWTETAWSKEKEALAQEIRELQNQLDTYERKD